MKSILLACLRTFSLRFVKTGVDWDYGHIVRTCTTQVSTRQGYARSVSCILNETTLRRKRKEKKINHVSLSNRWASSNRNSDASTFDSSFKSGLTSSSTPSFSAFFPFSSPPPTPTPTGSGPEAAAGPGADAGGGNSSSHLEQRHGNLHPRASSIRRRLRHSMVVSPSCCVTSTKEMVSSSPFLRSRSAVRQSCAVPEGKVTRAFGVHECVR